ncbi:MAG: MarR family transcriptional regulator [Clostridia bacterium]
MEKANLSCELVKMLIQLKKVSHRDIDFSEGRGTNKKMILFIIHENCIDGKILLSNLREKLKLAPSSVTAIITALENEGLIERKIDKNDRRNIFLQITPKGIDYTSSAHEKMINTVSEYINYIGRDDASQLLRIITKTTQYLKERGKINEESFK